MKASKHYTGDRRQYGLLFFEFAETLAGGLYYSFGL